MGREWNDKLHRRLTDSICIAIDKPRVTKLLVTDLENSDQTLVELIGEVAVFGDSGEWMGSSEQVIGQYLVKPKNRPQTLRYRAERGWPE